MADERPDIPEPNPGHARLNMEGLFKLVPMSQEDTADYLASLTDLVFHHMLRDIYNLAHGVASLFESYWPLAEAQIWREQQALLFPDKTVTYEESEAYHLRSIQMTVDLVQEIIDSFVADLLQLISDHIDSRHEKTPPPFGASMLVDHEEQIRLISHSLQKLHRENLETTIRELVRERN